MITLWRPATEDEQAQFHDMTEAQQRRAIRRKQYRISPDHDGLLQVPKEEPRVLVPGTFNS